MEIEFTDRAVRENKLIAKIGTPAKGTIMDVDTNTARSLIEQGFANALTVKKEKKSSQVETED